MNVLVKRALYMGKLYANHKKIHAGKLYKRQKFESQKTNITFHQQKHVYSNDV